MVTLSFDVGSSNCSIGYYDSSLPTMVSSGYNSHDIQSNIFLLNDKRIVGESIEKEVFANNIGNCISLFKHLLSRDINDSEVTKMKKFIPCEIIEEADNKIGFIIKYKNETIILSCEQILATMYNHLFKCSPLQLPRNVILTCPAFFTSSQRQAMLDASMIAEFKCEKILNESTAILSYYSLTNRDNDEVYSTILFINIGCTSGEVNLFSIKKEVCILLGSKHSLSLGGLFFDNIICKYFAKQIKSKFSKDIYEDKKSYLQLLHDCEIIKKRISGTTSDIACVFRNIANISEFKLSINRRTFEKLAREQFSILYVMIRTVLREAAFDSLKLEKIVLTGGSCKIPKIKEMLSNIFANATVDLIHQKHAVALGAVYFASSNLKVEIKNSIQIEGCIYGKMGKLNIG
uniref:Heat shock protein n=1 Tax=Rhabditophanes sp. KR3021 TaxID=114890 RepID=A0AC35TLA1_9BILA